MSNEMVFWLVTVIVLAVIEIATMQLVAIWPAIGGVGALAAATFNLSMTMQFAIFIVVSAVLLALTRPMVRRFLNMKKVSTNADRYIGSVAVVTEEIDNMKATGAAVISGVTWTARSADTTVIHAGEQVRVEHIEGAKLIVSRHEPMS